VRNKNILDYEIILDTSRSDSILVSENALSAYYSMTFND
jgi:hypothetical protein